MDQGVSMSETRRFKLTVLANNPDVLSEHRLIKAATLLLDRIGLRVTQFEELPPVMRLVQRQGAKKQQQRARTDASKWKTGRWLLATPAA
jgi:hypothetical protein